MENKTCIVAILKNEEPFLDEWILYHRMLGISHFFLYDDNPSFPLKDFLSPHADYVTVINWFGMDRAFNIMGSNQSKSYLHGLVNYAVEFDWVLFIDGDEFIVLRQHDTIPRFLSEFKDSVAVSLNWHVFGHNGYYENPEGLITSSLTRRLKEPNINIKTFNRPEKIVELLSAHYCIVDGLRSDANNRPFRLDLYPGRTDLAHINHYQCRSFKNWMNRSVRGDVLFRTENAPDRHRWRFTEESLLQKFVESVAKDRNEFVDEYMLKYKDALELQIKKIKR